jgi:CHAT domain-containing protein
VLSGCETGAQRSATGAPGLGLAEAFIAAGTRAVIGASRTVRDDDAEALHLALLPALAAHPADAASALRDAQLSVRKSHPSADWSAFRAFVR